MCLACGCASTGSKGPDINTPGPIQPQAILKFGDIPMPSGFKEIPGESYSFQSSGIRVGLLKYQGKADIEQIISFYKEQMPMYNWNLLNVVEYGQRMLNFDRQEETCIISLTPKGKNVIMIISVGPKSTGAKKIPAKPLK